MSKTIKVKYFALLREKAGLDEEMLTISDNETGESLFHQLSEKYSFSLNLSQCLVVVNEEYSPKDAILNEGDEVVFIPPVAGG